MMTVAPISPPTCCLVCALKVHIYVATSTRYNFWLSRISTVLFLGLPFQREMADALLHVDFETFMGGTILSMNVALMYV